MAFTLETMCQVFDDDDGSCIEVGPDGDGLEIVEIRYRTTEGKITERISMQAAQAALVRDALSILLGKAAA